MSVFELSDKEFKKFQVFIYKEAGISISDRKKQLVLNRLSRRLRHYDLKKFDQYLELVHGDTHSHEKQTLIDLLTTNETYFFREKKHFDFIQNFILKSFRGRRFRCWSAACSNGAEPYSLAMVINESLGPGRWEILGTDISSGVIEKARAAKYDISVKEKIPRDYLIKYCLKGVRGEDGILMIDPKITAPVDFKRLNLNGHINIEGKYDLIMLRNIMIYFDVQTKQKLVENLISRLHPGGYLIIGHSETLNGVSDKLKMIRPSIYRLGT